MKNYMNIKRLFEQEQAVSAQDFEELGMQPEMPEFGQEQMALPAAGQSSAPADPMTMTVADFIGKCKEIDPLVCMGIESFIEKNQMAFGGMQSAPMVEPTANQDLTFSNAVAQTPPMPPAQVAPAPAAPAPAVPQSSFIADDSEEPINFPG